MPTLRLARPRAGVTPELAQQFGAGLARFAESAETSADPRLLYALASQAAGSLEDLDIGTRTRLSALSDRLLPRLPPGLPEALRPGSTVDLAESVRSALDPAAQGQKADLVQLAGLAYAAGRGDLLAELAPRIEPLAFRQEVADLLTFLKLRQALEEKRIEEARAEAAKLQSDLRRTLAHLSLAAVDPDRKQRLAALHSAVTSAAALPERHQARLLAAASRMALDLADADYALALFESACKMANQARDPAPADIEIADTDAAFAVYIHTRYPHYFSLSLPGTGPLSLSAAIRAFPIAQADRLAAAVRTLHDEVSRAGLLIQILDLRSSESKPEVKGQQRQL